MSERRLNIKGRKKIDEWEYVIPYPVDRRVRSFPVAISMVSNGDGVIHFEAASEALPKRLMTSSDINALKGDVEAFFNSIDAGDEDVQWLDYLEVRMVGAGYDTFTNENTRQELMLSYTRVKIAFDSQGGMVKVGGDGRIGKVASGASQSKRSFGKEWDEGESVSYVEASQANIDALDDILRRIGELRRRLIEVMSPESIFKTLAAVDPLPLLPDLGEDQAARPVA